MQTIMAHVVEMHSRHGAYPESLAEIGMGSQVDGWESAFRYGPNDDGGYDLTSSGPDREFDTVDDINNLTTAIRPGDTPCWSEDSLRESKDYIKRVVGVAGDRVRVVRDVVYVNDEAIEQEAVEGDQGTAHGLPVRQAIDRVGETEYLVQYYGAASSFREITVREGHIFVMGDNRDDSSDSRCWGQVPIANVKGEALFIFWSGSDSGGFMNNRWGRMLDGID